MTCIALHKSWEMKLLLLMDSPPRYQSRNELYTTTQIWQMSLLWSMDPPGTRTVMTCIPLHKTWQMNLLWSMDPPVPQQGWLAYHYTKLGRWNYFSNGPPTDTRVVMTCIALHKSWQMNLLWLMKPHPVPEQRWLAYHYTKLGGLTYFEQWTPLPGTRAEMNCIPLHKNWQMNLLWWMDPPAVAEQRWLVYHYTKLGRGNNFGQWTLWVPQQGWLAYHYTKLGRWTYFGWWIPLPGTTAEMVWIPLHKTWQMNLLWPMDPLDITAGMTCIPLHKTWQMNILWSIDSPPRYQRRDDLHTTTQNLADEPTLADDVPHPVPDERWLAYQFTKTWLMNILSANGPYTSTRPEMACIPLHKTWQMNLIWPMDPLPRYHSRDDFHTTTQNLADEPTLANGPPPVPQ